LLVVGQPFDLPAAQEEIIVAINKKQPVNTRIFFINFNVDIDVFCIIILKDKVSVEKDALTKLKY